MQTVQFTDLLIFKPEYSKTLVHSAETAESRVFMSGIPFTETSNLGIYAFPLKSHSGSLGDPWTV